MTAATILKADRSARIDPITFEVIRHKLQAITEEQAITLKRVSGSPVVTEATDFNNGLYLADGSIVTMGPQVIFHTGTMSTVIRNIIKDFEPRGEIREGDMFILNDPYRGAIHQPDVSIVAPFFYKGRHCGWAGSCAHQLDVGGMSFGSWAYRATEVQQEAMLLTGLKLIDGGKLRDDLWQMIMSMTRLPNYLGLDLKGMIAANHVAIQRLTELFDRYGMETVDSVMNAEIDASERRMRERLRKIPDGIYRARDYIDHDGHTNALYRVCLAIHKKGDTLEFDLEGTSEQAPGFINCTWSGMKGALLTGLLPILAPDIRWNEGVLRPVTIHAPEGTLCNARWPAPVSGATVCAVWIVMNVAVAALSRMVSCAPDMVREAQAVTKGQMSVLTLAGLNRNGEAYGTLLLDSMAGGGGASIDKDGLDGSGDYDVPRPAIANVEANEAMGPILYLFRSFLPDTAGPGRMRGGGSTGLALVAHDVEGLDAMVIGHGVEVPNSTGLYGGLPGSCAYHLIKRSNQSVGALIDRYWNAELVMADSGVEDLGAKPGGFRIGQGDVFCYTFQGGGGYGDPLLREPSRVAQDIRDGHVSTESAANLYGVVAKGKSAEIDRAATEARRDAIRRERLRGKKPKTAAPGARNDGSAEMRIGEDRHFHCACGADLGPVSEDWKPKASMRKVPPSACGPHVRTHRELELREFSCPDCATLLELEVCRKDEDSLWSLSLS
ncbi:methylhydantoinase [Hypericibacter terrae]|uniref:Methylhydantoinase n=1 Tax=Hypericibacter terrae TaxID=2602015 RepID=A0A5J6MTW3_9PROT|nr:hydantoinase B/oxoprolinase family protein [Hypericibacter terrae]QEX19480.1 methylhydantoinase [Hypericibacter terrae]